MKCPKCGYANADGALVCNLCSEALRATAPAAPSPAAAPPAPAAAAADEGPPSAGGGSWFTLPRIGMGGLGIFLSLFGLKAGKDALWGHIESEVKNESALIQCKANLKALHIGFSVYAQTEPDRVMTDPAAAWADYVRTEEKKRVECPVCGQPYRMVPRRASAHYGIGFVILDPPGAHGKAERDLYAITEAQEYLVLNESEVSDLPNR